MGVGQPAVSALLNQSKNEPIPFIVETLIKRINYFFYLITQQWKSK